MTLPPCDASLLQIFPLEVLSETFTVAEMSHVVVLSHVCRQWREAALGDSALWLEIGVCNRDVHHIPIIIQLLQRSKGRKISIGMDFRDLQRPENPALFGRLLRLVRTHLWRTCHLFIYAQWQTWQMIIAAFGNQAYPNLSLLDVEPVFSPPVQTRDWGLQIPPNGMAEPFAGHTALLQPVVFSIPHNHRLRVNGITLANTRFRNLALIRISGNHPPNLVGSDGRLNRWLLDGPKSLYLENMQIPPMLAYVPQNLEERKISTITHLILSGLSARSRAATGADGLPEHSCIPFFDSLYTPRVRCLQIDRWHLHSRVWTDFLEWLPEDTRFPYVVDLRITGMHLQGMDYDGIAFFL
ncbi:hypothetical protein B0H14DRAFT_2781837, partial [Mycena olivaceomarginata]